MSLTSTNVLLLLVTLLALALFIALAVQRRYYRGMVSDWRDAEKQSEEAIWDLDESRHRLKAVFGGMQEAIILLRKDGEVLLVNPAFERFFGVSASAAKGKNILEVLRNKDLHRIVGLCLEEKKNQTVQIEIPAAEPQHFEVHVVYLSGDGRQENVLAVLHDITFLQKAEAIRRDFVANVSHELRTPLGVITGSIETLLDGAMKNPDECQEFLRIVRDNASRLGELIDDLLDLAKIESQEISFKQEKVNAQDAVGSSLAAFQARLTARKIKVSVDVDPGLQVQADSQRIKQVFNNLLDNAIKFNRDEGSIRIAANPRRQMVEFSVQDSGRGIPPEDIGRVFERFYRVDKDRQRSPNSGTGLGLSIAKHIVEKHGGRIWARSEPDKGSTFFFTLPASS